MELVIKDFSALSVEELYDILQLRVAIFVVEQRCPYQEIDGVDKHAVHVFLRDAEGIQAYVRVMDRGVTFEEASIGRVLTRKKRRSGLGTQVLRAGIDIVQKRFHADAIRIEAQTYARAFYENVGFRQASEEFLEDDIPHIQMLLRL